MVTTTYFKTVTRGPCGQRRSTGFWLSALHKLGQTLILTYKLHEFQFKRSIFVGFIA